MESILQAGYEIKSEIKMICTNRTCIPATSLIPRKLLNMGLYSSVAKEMTTFSFLQGEIWYDTTIMDKKGKKTLAI
jgi:hypothetical protein